ncbi:MAG: hypothetical protein AB8G16_16920 [Gammaproteobacteria bacterium]
MALKLRWLFIAAALGAQLCGCNERGVREVLDEETFVSVISMTPPYNFYRLRLDDNIEREFLSAGPIERIQSAERGHYLWVNAWAVRRDGAHETVTLTADITLETDRGDLTLKRAATSHRDLDVSKPAYRVIRSGEGEAYYALSEDDIDALRGATITALRFAQQRYALWGDQDTAQQAMQDFILETTGY